MAQLVLQEHVALDLGEAPRRKIAQVAAVRQGDHLDGVALGPQELGQLAVDEIVARTVAAIRKAARH